MMKKQVLLIWLLILTVPPLGCFAQEPFVPTQTLINVAGLKAKVTVRRDERGIPYIEAANEADLYFAQGYAAAQDRLWQMDTLRRVARGETAEIFGKLTLEEDKRWRKYGFARIVEENLKIIAPDIRSSLENYARGVNAYIASLDDKSLPPEFRILQYRPREWQPEDSLVIGKILSEGLSSSWRFDLLKASLADLPADKRAQLLNVASPHDVLLIGKDVAAKRGNGKEEKGKTLAAETASSLANNSSFLFSALLRDEEIRRASLERIGFYAEDLAASNNWVISGKRTADGKPILANDPHLPATAPPIWCLVNLNAPTVHAAGVSLPGTPGVILGHNENIAWGATNVGPDVQDLYLEQFDAANPKRYKTPNGFAEANVRREEIKVRQNPLNPATTSEFLDVVTTRNGVIFFEDKAKRYALRWTAFDPKNGEFDAFFSLNRAKNWNDFRAALKTYGGATQNFVYADTSGNIGWYAAGRVPIRASGDGSVPYDGATDAGAWTSFVPFEELPNLYNPPEGLIVTANQRTVGKSYKYQEIVRDFASPFRARRIFDLLSANPKIKVDDVRDVQHDNFNIAVSRFGREVVNLKAASDEILKLFAGWDGRMNADSKAALVANEMRNAFRQRILAANLGADRAANYSGINEGAFLDFLITDKPKNWLPKEFASYADLLKASEKQARENLTKRVGADETKWTWGGANKIRIAHPLAAAPLIGGQFVIPELPLNGSSGAVNVGASVSMRLIATPGNWDLTRQVIPTGESGLPSSLHYKDQLDAWYTGNTPVFPFSGAAVKRAAKEILILSP